MIDFLGIGAQKAGSTWLMANLKKHPDVWTPIIKELHYFDVVHLDTEKQARLYELKKTGERAIEKMYKNGNYREEKAEYLRSLFDQEFAFTDKWYAHIFSKAPKRKIKGEITPYYCAIGVEGINHVKALMPDVKLIFIIRDPVERAISSLRMVHAWSPKAKQNDIISNPGFQLRGDYASNVSAWDSAFPAEQLLYIPFGRIKTEPLEVLRDVEAFLALHPFDNYPRIADRINSATKTIAVEEESIKSIKRLSEPQYAFIRERFGEEFLAKIK